eukprot:CAMPEP_0118641074 /NCGR_PEP_ID=MMETSP0785-20121206/5087_1 /TAXON_ID=91992 /ORGANISM="Bolidomonas pacifica, Strain CCMP 1866" /LENGTH=80 /DNA_ID=CAMNT_0006532493 /DNA_START=297 /DNA_END=535 /DNA_ORIENTATION=-
MNQNEPYVRLARRAGATKECESIAYKSGLSDSDLFYLNFDKVQPPLVPLELLTEWVDTGCLGTFLSTEYVGGKDISSPES